MVSNVASNISSKRISSGLFRLSFIALTSLFIHGCGSGEEAKVAEPVAAVETELTPISVSGSYWIELSPVLVAAHNFYPIEMTVGEGGLNRMTSGEIDIATNAETQLLRASVDNPDLRIIMTVTESFYRLVGRRSAGIEKLEDLRGKRIMMPNYTSAGYYLEAMLRSVGMTQDDVELVGFPRAANAKLGMDMMAEALANHEVDAISIWEPTPEDAIHMLGDDAIVLQDRSVYREVFNLHAWAGDLADPEKRRSIVEFVRSVAKATEALKENSAPYTALVSQYTTYSSEQIEASWPEMEFPIHIIPDMLDVLVTEEQWVASISDREPRSREELAKLIDYSVLEEALAK